MTPIFLTLPKAKLGNRIERTYITYSWITVSSTHGGTEERWGKIIWRTVGIALGNGASKPWSEAYYPFSFIHGSSDGKKN